MILLNALRKAWQFRADNEENLNVTPHGEVQMAFLLEILERIERLESLLTADKRR